MAASSNATPSAAPWRTVRYPRQLIVMASDELADRIAADSKRHGISKSEVARTYLEAGIAAGEAEALAGAKP